MYFTTCMEKNGIFKGMSYKEHKEKKILKVKQYFSTVIDCLE